MSFVLAHLSDAHIGPLPPVKWHELLGKRATGYANWLNGRARSQGMDVLAAVVNDLLAQRPDHIAMTGDILNLGLRGEFPLAGQWLASIGSPDHVSFTPGNHDAYAPSTFALVNRTFEPWMRGDAHPSQRHADAMPVAFPYVRKRGNVALIGLSSAIPTAPFLASGKLGTGQLARLATVLRDCGERALARVILIHHPPHSSGAKSGRGLRDAVELASVIAREGAELILHGHNHRMSLSHIAGKSGPVPVAGVASASDRQRAGYRLFRITALKSGHAIAMRTATVRLASPAHLLRTESIWTDLAPQ